MGQMLCRRPVSFRQIPSRPSRIIHLNLQLRNDHLVPGQLDPLQRFYALFEADPGDVSARRQMPVLLGTQIQVQAAATIRDFPVELFLGFERAECSAPAGEFADTSGMLKVKRARERGFGSGSGNCTFPPERKEAQIDHVGFPRSRSTLPRQSSPDGWARSDAFRLPAVITHRDRGLSVWPAFRNCARMAPGERRVLQPTDLLCP
jgi:hypothetical protein